MNDQAHIGSGYGGWSIPADFASLPHPVCYCIGAGEDISFDVGLARAYAAEVHIFDPTPRAVAHFAALEKNTRAGLPAPVNNSAETYNIDMEALSRIHFHPQGIWKNDGAQRFYAPRKAHYVSHSIGNNDRTAAFFEADCLTLASAMKKLGHARLDLLKIDAEGAEHEILASLLDSPVRPVIICLEFDRYEHPPLQARFRIWRTLRRMKRAGYARLWRDGPDFTFAWIDTPSHT